MVKMHKSDLARRATKKPTIKNAVYLRQRKVTHRRILRSMFVLMFFFIGSAGLYFSIEETIRKIGIKIATSI